MSVAWVRTYENGADWSASVNGVLWGTITPPLRLHWCFPQTRSVLGGEMSERCNCGAIRFDGGGPWVNRNQTRKAARKARREARLPQVTVTCGCGAQYQAGQGTALALARECTDCWAERFLASEGGSA